MQTNKNKTNNKTNSQTKNTQVFHAYYTPELAKQQANKAA
jgi:hypothetical protein